MWVLLPQTSPAALLQALPAELLQARLMKAQKVQQLAVQQLAPSLQVLGLQVLGLQVLGLQVLGLQVLGLQVPELSARLQQVCLALALSALDLLRPDYWWQARTRLAQVQNPQMPAAPRPSPQP